MLARKPWEFYRWQKVDSKYWSWEEFFSKKMEIYWLKTRVWWVNWTLFWLISILSIFKVPNFKLIWKILMSVSYKLILQWVTLGSLKMRYRVSCGPARVSCFLPQHWFISQYVKHIIVSDSRGKGKDTVVVFLDLL